MLGNGHAHKIRTHHELAHQAVLAGWGPTSSGTADRVPTWHPEVPTAPARTRILLAGSSAATTATAVSVIPAAMANAVVYPLTSATAWLAVCAFAVTAEAIAASTARPTAPPTCWLVLKMPEARPWSSCLASEVAVIVSGTKASPSPVATNRSPGKKPLR